tara:strand:- start:1453 stop:2124 length:672 start_codon:yes stop_codon:yes gene_type:complete
LTVKEKLEIKSIAKKRIGIFGGAFDPIHYGHTIPTQEIIEAHQLDKVHFVPTNIPTSSKKIIASSTDRIDMMKICLNDSNSIIDDREISRGGISYMIDTIESIKKDYTNANLYLLIGIDVLQNINLWKSFDKIIKTCNIIVSSRSHKSIDYVKDINKNSQLHPLISTDRTIFHSDSYGKIYLEETSMINTSSTEIRDKLGYKQSVRGLISPQLEKWLSKHKIY